LLCDSRRKSGRIADDQCDEKIGQALLGSFSHHRVTVLLQCGCDKSPS
jgi:hypothetical protein